MPTASSRNEPKTMEFSSTAQSHFDCMMKLLLFQEVELQFKEEIISLLMEDEKVREILNKKLEKLNKTDVHDPILALERDQLYNEETWNEFFQDWASPTPPFSHTVQNNSSFLGASTALRTVEIAETQCKKFKNTFHSLEKMAYAYKKLRNKLHKERNEHAQELKHTTDITKQMELECERLNQELQAEKLKTRELEKHVYLLTSTLAKERKKCVKVVRTLMHEIENLTEQLKLYSQTIHHPNGLVNGSSPDSGHTTANLLGNIGEQRSDKRTCRNMNGTVNGHVNGKVNEKTNGIVQAIPQRVVVG